MTLCVYREIGGTRRSARSSATSLQFNRSLRLKARKSGMTLNQRGEWATTPDPTVGPRKTDGVFGAGLYGGVVRDLKDPSKKTISGERLNSIKPLFCGFLLCAFPAAVADRWPYCSQAICLRLRRRGRFWRSWGCRGRSLTNVHGRMLYERSVVLKSFCHRPVPLWTSWDERALRYLRSFCLSMPE